MLTTFSSSSSGFNLQLRTSFATRCHTSPWCGSALWKWRFTNSNSFCNFKPSILKKMCEKWKTPKIWPPSREWVRICRKKPKHRQNQNRPLLSVGTTSGLYQSFALPTWLWLRLIRHPKIKQYMRIRLWVLYFIVSDEFKCGLFYINTSEITYRIMLTLFGCVEQFRLPLMGLCHENCFSPQLS